MKLNPTAIVIFFMVLVPYINADTFYVDDDETSNFSTIQEALDYSWHGDTIIVKPGIYREDINFNGRAITLTSEDPDSDNIVESTIINGTMTFDFLENSSFSYFNQTFPEQKI